jgi:hypothetical protein
MDLCPEIEKARAPGRWSVGQKDFDRAGRAWLAHYRGAAGTQGDRGGPHLRRWGRVTPSGIQIDIPLTHRLLALVVGARRPSVTASARELSQAGRIEPQAGSRWLLHGDPPAELREIHEHAADHERPLPLEIVRAPGPDVTAPRRSRQLG